VALAAAAESSAQEAPVVPGATWTRAKPETVGFSGARLEALRAWAAAGDTTAMVIVVDGRLIFEQGDTALVSKVASVRKSILALLYGSYVAKGTVDLRKTVADLGLQEAEPFLPIETAATLEHLLTARSGVYLRSGNDNLDLQTPKRGSKAPGTYHDYNNWDFNAAGTAFEKLTGQSIYDALERDLARPIGMEDFDRSRQRKVPSPGSVHPEYVMNLSTRDLARFGLLMLRGGRWGDREVVPPGWCRYITTLVTPFERINPDGLSIRGRFDRWGYGVMWWVWEEPIGPGGVSMGPLQGAYTAWGAGGQYVTVLPAMNMVVAHKVDIDRRGSANVGPMAYDAMLAMAVEAHCPDSGCP
jgi:CubicO group peptidase (beta-lactamase class C family)